MGILNSHKLTVHFYNILIIKPFIYNRRSQYRRLEKNNNHNIQH